MDSRFARAVVSFALVASAYWAYLNVAEPLMARPLGESPITVTPPSVGITPPGTSPAALQSEPVPAPRPTDRFLEMIAPYFPEGSWERNTGRIIKNDQFMLLFRDFKTTTDGRLHVFPCTIVFQPQGLQKNTPVKADERTWIVQAPQGAILSFDEPMDERMMKVGRLEAAFVQGQVTIRGSESKPGAGDRIELTTQNVQLSEQRIWTPSEVYFRIGPHFGSGRDLTIAMAPVTRGEIKRLPTTVPARIQSVELVHLDKLQVSVPRQREVPAGNGRTIQSTEYVPVNINCDGFLLMEMARGVAKITKNVRISRPRLDQTGLEDQLECENLSLYFSRNLIFADDGRTRPPPFEFERLIATGTPAVAYSTAPGQGLASAKYLLEAPKFECVLKGRPEFIAEGAGRLRGSFGDEGQSRLAEVSWQAALTYKEQDRGALIAVDQQALVSVDSLGTVAAERFQVQLKETGSSAGRLASMQPETVTAQGRVRAEMRGMKAQVGSLKVAFRDRELKSADRGLRLNSPQSAQVQPPNRNFIVTGDTLQLGVVRDDQEVAIDDLIIERSVRCVEVIGNNEGRGAEITGDRLELKQIASGAAIGALSGSPVAIRANRLDVRGPMVRFEQASNRIWIEGAGSAALPLPPRMVQQFAGRAAVGYLNWQRSLTFDGTVARADGGVEMRGPAQLIRCATVEAKLSRPIRFAEREAGARLNLEGVELSNITADGGVTIENRTFDNRGLVAIDTGTMKRLTIDQATSEFLGVGPGQIKTVRFNDSQLGSNQVLAKPKPRPLQSLAKPDQLGHLRVQFQRQVAGNLQTRRLSFDDRVQAIYGPVQNWDVELPDDPRALAQGQVSLRCDRLSVAQVLRRGQQQGSFEFESQGNTIVEGREFQARADRLTYDQAKDLIILRGGARDDAEIVRRSGGKQQSTSARVIKYRPKGNRVDVEGANEIRLN